MSLCNLQRHDESALKLYRTQVISLGPPHEDDVAASNTKLTPQNYAHASVKLFKHFCLQYSGYVPSPSKLYDMAIRHSCVCQQGSSLLRLNLLVSYSCDIGDPTQDSVLPEG
jgi:hypothetical protein